MVFPKSFEVLLHRRTVTTNSFWDETEVLGDPERVLCFGWYLSGATRIQTAPDGHINRVEWDATLYADVGDGIKQGDRVTLPGYGVFIVSGEVGEWEHNPWWKPGMVQVNLKRVGDRDASRQSD